jgi:hypothetical protein
MMRSSAMVFQYGKDTAMLYHRWIGRLALTVALAGLLPSAGSAREIYLPVDSEIVFTINLRQLLDSPLIKDNLLGQAREAVKNSPAADVLKELGLDPFKDLDRITVAGPASKEQDRGLVIIRGKFNTDKLKAKAEELIKAEATAADKPLIKKLKVPDGNGGDAIIYQIRPPEAPMAFFVTIMDGKTILASPGKDYVVDAIRMTAEKPVELKAKGIQALLDKMDERQSFSIAAISEVLGNALGDLGGGVGGLDKVTAVSGGLTLTDELKLEVGISTKDTDAAKELHDSLSGQLNFALALAAGIAQGIEANPGLDVALELLKSVRVTAKDKTVFIKGRVNADTLQDLLKKDK